MFNPSKESFTPPVVLIPISDIIPDDMFFKSGGRKEAKKLEDPNVLEMAKVAIKILARVAPEEDVIGMKDFCSKRIFREKMFSG